MFKAKCVGKYLDINGTNSLLQLNIVWHGDPLLDNDREISKYTTASQTSTFSWQKLETATEERCFLCSPCRDAISGTVSES
jgi:hypothetical protein